MNNRLEIFYDIISYDPDNRGLESVADRVVNEFVSLAGFSAKVSIRECRNNKEAAKTCNKLYGIYPNKNISIKLAQLRRAIPTHSKPSGNVKRKTLVVTSLDIGSILGVSCESYALISTNRISNGNILDVFATVVFHELGHMQNAPNHQKTHRIDLTEKYKNIKCKHKNIDDAILELEKYYSSKKAYYQEMGEHCLSRNCVMRQRLEFRNWSEHLTQDRINISSPYCPCCLADIKDYIG